MWEVDKTPIKSKEDIDCKQLYERTFVRTDGRFSVTLFLQPDAELSESKTQALRRCHSVERRLRKQPNVREKFILFMDGYERLGHTLKAEPLNPTVIHYYSITFRTMLHALSVDRKFRVVFDASARTSNEKSLKDVQYAGPTAQRPLADILMSFRSRRIAMSADIAKIFLHILKSKIYCAFCIGNRRVNQLLSTGSLSSRME